MGSGVSLIFNILLYFYVLFAILAIGWGDVLGKILWLFMTYLVGVFLLLYLNLTFFAIIILLVFVGGLIPLMFNSIGLCSLSSFKYGYISNFNLLSNVAVLLKFISVFLMWVAVSYVEMNISEFCFLIGKVDMYRISNILYVQQGGYVVIFAYLLFINTVGLCLCLSPDKAIIM